VSSKQVSSDLQSTTAVSEASGIDVNLIYSFAVLFHKKKGGAELCICRGMACKAYRILNKLGNNVKVK
jgi:hypothetical protein